MEVAERERRSWQLRWWLKSLGSASCLDSGERQQLHQLIHSQTTTSCHSIPLNRLLFTARLQRRDTQSNHVNITTPTLPPSRPHQTVSPRTSTRCFPQPCLQQRWTHNPIFGISSRGTGNAECASRRARRWCWRVSSALPPEPVANLDREERGVNRTEADK